MGSSYSFDGSISVEPALNFLEIRKARKIAMTMLRPKTFDSKHAKEESVFEGYMPLKPDVTEFEEDSDRGTLLVKRASEFIPSHRENGALSYSMEGLMDALVKGLPGHTWSGTVTALQEDLAFAYKLVVDVTDDHKQGLLRRIEQFSGRTFIHWEDGTETKVSDLG